MRFCPDTEFGQNPLNRITRDNLEANYQYNLVAVPKDYDFSEFTESR
jgi:hypothetical protein